jgi:hypothetical protein
MARAKTSQNKTQFTRPNFKSGLANKAMNVIKEKAEVVDVILHPNHPEFNPQRGRIVGCIQARTTTRINQPLENVEWYHPMLQNLYSQYPLIGENVLLVKGAGKGSQKNPIKFEKYYLPAVNVFHNVNNNQNAGISTNALGDTTEDDICNPSGQYSSNPGIEKQDQVEEVPLGKTFVEKEIAPLFPYEGDTIIQGRFGASIRMGSTSTFADTPNYWSSEGLNGDAITIISNGHSVAQDSDYHIEDINRDCSVIMYCEGQLIPIYVASDIWDSYGTTFDRKQAEQKALDIIQDKEVQKHDDPEDETDEKDDACPDGYVMNEEGDCEEQPSEQEEDDDFESNQEVTGVVKKCWDADEANGNDERKLLLKEMVDDLVANGATPEGASALIGNFLSEGAGPICTSAPSKDPGKAVASALYNLEKWRTDKSSGPQTKSNQNGYWNGVNTTERGGTKCDGGCWCGVGAFETRTVYKNKTYGPNESDPQFTRYANWQGGVGLIQWTGVRRTKFEIALGVPPYYDGTGGYLWPKTPFGKGGGGKWKNGKLVTPPTEIGITPKPHNRTEYNRAILNATYRGSKPGLNAQLVYSLIEMKSGYRSVYDLVTKSRDIGKITFEIYAKFATPTSYIYGRPGGKNPSGISNKPSKGSTYSDYYNHSVKKRTENAENTYITWKGFLFPDPPTAAPVSTNVIQPPAEDIVISREDGYFEVEVYGGFKILQETGAEEEFAENTRNDQPAWFFYNVETAFVPSPQLENIQDKQGFKDFMVPSPSSGPMFSFLRQLRSGYSEYHDLAGKDFPSEDAEKAFGPEGYIFAIKAFIDEQIEDWIDEENS